MDSKLSSRPLYLQLAEVLLQRILVGEWKSGALLRNEIDLAKEYGLSVGTMRKALQELESLQVIRRQQGRGTTVADRSQQDFMQRYENTFTLAGHQPVWHARSCVIDEVSATAGVSVKLKLSEGQPVIRCVQVLHEGSKAVALEEIHVPKDMFEGLEKRNGYDLYLAAREAGVFLGKGFEELSFETPSPKVRDVLKLGEHGRVVVFDRLIYSLQQRPVEWRRRWCEMNDFLYRASIG